MQPQIVNKLGEFDQINVVLSGFRNPLIVRFIQKEGGVVSNTFTTTKGKNLLIYEEKYQNQSAKYKLATNSESGFDVELMTNTIFYTKYAKLIINHNNSLSKVKEREQSSSSIDEIINDEIINDEDVFDGNLSIISKCFTIRSNQQWLGVYNRHFIDGRTIPEVCAEINISSNEIENWNNDHPTLKNKIGHHIPVKYFMGKLDGDQIEITIKHTKIILTLSKGTTQKLYNLSKSFGGVDLTELFLSIRAQVTLFIANHELFSYSLNLETVRPYKYEYSSEYTKLIEFDLKSK